MDEQNMFVPIPDNYSYWGNKLRNIVEAVILDGINIGVVYMLHMSVRHSLMGLLPTIPLTALCIMGIGEQSLITALINWLKFMGKRRVLAVPDKEYIRQRDKAILKKELRKGGKNAK